MYQLFNTLCRVVIAILPRSKHLLISWVELPAAVILEPKKMILEPKKMKMIYRRIIKKIWIEGHVSALLLLLLSRVSRV